MIKKKQSLFTFDNILAAMWIGLICFLIAMFANKNLQAPAVELRSNEFVADNPALCINETLTWESEIKISRTPSRLKSYTSFFGVDRKLNASPDVDGLPTVFNFFETHKDFIKIKNTSVLPQNLTPGNYYLIRSFESSPGNSELSMYIVKFRVLDCKVNR